MTISSTDARFDGDSAATTKVRAKLAAPLTLSISESRAISLALDRNDMIGARRIADVAALRAARKPRPSPPAPPAPTHPPLKRFDAEREATAALIVRERNAWRSS